MTVAHAALIAASATTASPAGQAPGRVCPLRYRYGPTAIARAETRLTDTLYVVGGLYGNLPALNAIEMMARNDHPVGARPPVLCFNGDFNWFNVDDRAFAEINLRVLADDAILGNVEAELDAPADDAGCGCAYPDSVDAGVVERSNRTMPGSRPRPVATPTCSTALRGCRWWPATALPTAASASCMATPSPWPAGVST